VGYACGARHSHLCNGGYSLDQRNVEFNKDTLTDEIWNEEVSRNILNSLTICLFARNLYDTDTILAALDAVGKTMTKEDLQTIAKRIYATKLRIKKKLGFDLKSVKIPERIMSTPAMGKKIDPEIVQYMIDKFGKKNEELLAQFNS
jgi:aldehyde:ferredoxin oxidoreductase